MPRKKGCLNKKYHYKLEILNDNIVIKKHLFRTAKDLAKFLDLKVKFIYDLEKYNFTQKKTKDRLKNILITKF